MPVWSVSGPPPFELIEDATDDDPQYRALLAAISEAHRGDATPADYTRAALRVLREIS